MNISRILLLISCLTLSNFAFSDEITDGLNAYDRAEKALSEERYKIAFNEMSKAADIGYAPAIFKLGVMYRKGLGVKKNNSYAVSLYEIAAKLGQVDAQSNLGVMYYSGDGALQNYGTAIKWWKLAADNGSASAKNNLGLMYSKGVGVEKDTVVAFKLISEASAQGDSNAQANLAAMYFSGIGTSKNLILAHAWSNISSSLGNAAASLLRAKVSKLLSPEDIVEAQNVAKKCILNEFANCID